MMVWHRLRRHRIRDQHRHVDTSSSWAGGYGVLMEPGRVDHVRVCSCGRAWLRVLVNPLLNTWRWS